MQSERPDIVGEAIASIFIAGLIVSSWKWRWLILPSNLDIDKDFYSFGSISLCVPPVETTGIILHGMVWPVIPPVEPTGIRTSSAQRELVGPAHWPVNSTVQTCVQMFAGLLPVISTGEWKFTGDNCKLLYLTGNIMNNGYTSRNYRY